VARGFLLNGYWGDGFITDNLQHLSDYSETKHIDQAFIECLMRDSSLKNIYLFKVEVFQTISADSFCLNYLIRSLNH
jgi:hypothetical protein